MKNSSKPYFVVLKETPKEPQRFSRRRNIYLGFDRANEALHLATLIYPHLVSSYIPEVYSPHLDLKSHEIEYRKSIHLEEPESRIQGDFKLVIGDKDSQDGYARTFPSTVSLLFENESEMKAMAEIIEPHLYPGYKISFYAPRAEMKSEVIYGRIG